jgi:hypothetical protein
VHLFKKGNNFVEVKAALKKAKRFALLLDGFENQ